MQNRAAQRHCNSRRRSVSAQRRGTPFRGSVRRAAASVIAKAAVAFCGSVGLAAPAAAQGVIGPNAGRVGATVAALVGLLGVVAGGLAQASAAGRIGKGNGRDGAIVALVLGLVGITLAALHLATSSGGIGTGNGRAGALVALFLGGIALVLGRLVLVRSSGRN